MWDSRVTDEVIASTLIPMLTATREPKVVDFPFAYLTVQQKKILRETNDMFKFTF